MRLYELLKESESYRDIDLPLSKYRGPYDPRTDNLSAYGKEYAEASDLWAIIDELVDAGIDPELKEVSISSLLATQDWLSTEPGEGPMWEEYSDYPVVIDHNNQRLILDGHHRISKARRQGKKSIRVYYFLG